eukprot:CAMPEP_0179063238 /NCGR_PEP_ID=MMETSP0796-20121207/27332_1 /TAXON_ID=73915 /ORGANISM="Pyrodinium bahamense, Strain pbaha01" /LENGTH=31 /DNA_ID= /DNA_START= /DNA_END= /DNA_ORIENTATION=
MRQAGKKNPRAQLGLAVEPHSDQSAWNIFLT